MIAKSRTLTLIQILMVRHQTLKAMIATASHRKALTLAKPIETRNQLTTRKAIVRAVMSQGKRKDVLIEGQDQLIQEKRSVILKGLAHLIH